MYEIKKKYIPVYQIINVKKIFIIIFLFDIAQIQYYIV